MSCSLEQEAILGLLHHRHSLYSHEMGAKSWNQLRNSSTPATPTLPARSCCDRNACICRIHYVMHYSVLSAPLGRQRPPAGMAP